MAQQGAAGGRPGRRTGVALLALGGAALLPTAAAAAAPTAAPAAAVAAPTGVVAYLSTADALVPVDLRTRATGRPIPLGGAAEQVVVSPDGATAWALLAQQAVVRKVDLRAGTVGPPLAVGSRPHTIALTPDGRTAWVSSIDESVLTTIDTTTSARGTLDLGHQSSSGIAFSPDGRTAFVGSFCDGTVTTVDVTSGRVLSEAVLQAQMFYACTSDVALAPDGRTVYAGDEFGGSGLTPVDVATGQRRPAITWGSYDVTRDVVVSADSRTAYVRPDGPVKRIDLRSGRVVDALPSASGYAQHPSGRSLLVLRSGQPGVAALSTSSGTLGRPFATSVAVRGVAVAPAQAPVAAFTATVTGSTVSVDAGGSAGRTSRIARYAWRFGDGTVETTTVPRTSHTYAQGGEFQVWLTVTDEIGTSDQRLFNGQVLLRNGGPSASTGRGVRIP